MMRSRGESLSEGVSLFSRWFSCLGLLLMTLIIVVQVFARYVLNDSPVWAEQAALLLMIWYVFVAAAAGVREGFHIRIAVVADALPPTLQKIVRLTTHALVVLFGVAMVFFGTRLAIATWEHVIPTLGLSRGFAYIPIALSGTLIVGFATEQFFAELHSKEVKTLWS